MVQIRKITRGNPLSTTRSYQPQGGTAFRALGTLMQDAYDNFLEPLAIEEMQQRADEDWTGYARGVMSDNRVPGPTRAQSARRSLQGTTALSAPSQVTSSPIDGEWLTYKNQGATRNLPLSDELVSALSYLPEMGVSVEVFSGGQPRKGSGGARVGSVRHDDGNAADVFFYKDGRRLDWANPDDLPIFREIVSRGRAAGLTGFGAGEGYMQPGSMHIGFGNEAVWGADGKGVNAPGWLREAFNAPGERVASDTMEALSPAQPAPDAPGQSIISSKGDPVTIRTSDGRLEPRLFSPASGPILQAYNAAAAVATMSEVSMQAQADLLNLSQEYRGDPAGFQQAADGYIEGIVENFDPQMRRDVRAALTQEVSRRHLGILDEQHRDISRRADNSSKAMVDRLSQDYADAIASGDQSEIARTRAELDDVLYARESLPGVSWTPAQSENVLINAERTAARVQAQRQADTEREWKGDLDLIIKARKEGLTGANEAILQNPAVWEAHPDLAREAQATILFQSQVPQFQQMTPAEMDAAIADLEENPVSDEFQIDILNAARGIRNTQAAAFEEDPIARAGAVLENPPPAIDGIDPANPQGFIDQLGARADYVEGLVQRGYIDRPVYLSKAEADSFAAMFDKEVPDEVRGLAAQALVEGFGEDAMIVFDQIDVPHEIALAGKLTAAGGPQQTMGLVLRGQRMLDEGLVSVPAQMSRLETFPADMQEALSGLPVSEPENFAQVRDLARNIYAATVAGQELDDEQKGAAMEAAIQMALGQGSDVNDRTTGGVQEIAGKPTWLPVGVAGERVNSGLQALAESMPVDAAWVAGMMDPRALAERDGAMWMSVGPEGAPESLPYLGGEPLPAKHLRDGNVRLVPDESGFYRMEYVAGPVPREISREDGSLYLIDLDRLLEANLP